VRIDLGIGRDFEIAIDAEHLPTDTFMSGKPAGSCALVMAAVVINPSEVSDAPETRFAAWLRMGAGRNLAE